MGLLGLNGAGKSTILKMLGTFLLPSQGRARVAGYCVEEEPHAVRRSMGFLPDTPPVYTEMTVEAFLKYVAGIKGVERRQLKAHVQEAVERCHLQEVQQARIDTLSHGFRQRVGIAQSLVHKPQVLVLDEPINGLDPVQIVEMRDLIMSLRREHTLLLSSHILSEITKTCDRIFIIDEGQLVAQGSEAYLQKAARQVRLLKLRLQRCPAQIVEQLKAWPEIEKVTQSTPRCLDSTQSEVELMVEVNADVRVELARLLVDQDCGLLSMVQEDMGLEGLFVQLIQNHSSKGGRP